MAVRTLLPLMLALAAGVPAAGAAVDVNGHFIGAVGQILGFGPFFCSSVDVVQSGSSIALTAQCDVFGPASFAASGTIDSTTGAFTATGQGSILCTAPGSLTINATGTPDGYAINGSVVCGVPATFAASRCGNGLLDGGEAQACDDAVAQAAPAFAVIGCCDDHCGLRPSGASCTTNPPSFDGCDAPDVCDGVAAACPNLKQPDGTSCDDLNSCTQGDTCSSGACVASTIAGAGTPCFQDPDVPCVEGFCDGAGTCQPEFTTNPCDDGDACTTNDVCADGVCGGDPVSCTPCETCDSFAGCIAAIDATCKFPLTQRSSVALKTLVPDDKDKLAWTWRNGTVPTTGEFGDPVSGTAYTLCVYDHQNAATPMLLAEIGIPPGAGWSPRVTGFRYRSTTGGVRSVTLKAGDFGRAKLVVKGGGPQLGLPATLNAVETPVVVQLKADNGVCWEADYATALRSNPIEFKARGGSTN